MKLVTKVLTVILFACIAITTNAQDTLYIYNSGGTIDKYDVTQIDSIKFTPPAQSGSDINADLVLEYSIAFEVASSYVSGTVDIDLDAIAALFEITKEELLAGIEKAEGALPIVGFAIEGTTGEDNPAVSNTSGPWGHWWDANGDVVGWGENAMVFAEWNIDEDLFTVGQYPDHLIPGQEITVIEGLSYNGKRAVIVINYTALDPGADNGVVVATQDLSIDINPKSDYTQDLLTFDLAAALAAIGVENAADAKFMTVKADGSFTDAYNADAPGFWYGLDGNLGAWGDNASVFNFWPGDNTIGIGQFPDRLAAGETYVIKCGLRAGDKIVMFTITINVVAP